MEAALITFFILLGVTVASFLNVCIDRLPAGDSLISPGSHCASCHHPLSIKDLIPVVSYLWLRGRCRYCRAPVARRLFWVEISTGLLFGYLYWHYGLTIELPVSAFYGCLFIVLMVIDLEHGLLLNRIVYPTMLVAITISVFLPPSRLIYSCGAAPPLISNLLPELGIIQSVIGGSIGLGLFFLIVIISRGGMGWGDVKMAALIGMVTGFPLVFVALLLAVILGGLAAIIMLMLKMRKRKEGIPFAPFLSLGAMATILWGSNIINWYLGIF